VMEFLCRRVEAVAREVTCSILRIEPDGTIRHLAAPSLPDGYTSAIDGIKIGPAVGSCGTAAWRGEPVLVTDIATDPLWADYKGLALDLGLHACWSTPIRTRDGTVVGTFAFYYRTPRGPSPFEQEVVGHCVHLCSIAIEQTDSRSRVHQLAYYDQTTGLANREMFKRRAVEALAHGLGDGSLLAVHYVDLDHFKSVNDNLGHAVGDMLLHAVGDRLRACVGHEHLLARLGGDEFAILQRLEGSDDAARDLARRMLDAFSAPLSVGGQYVDIGISAGISVAPRDGVDIDSLMMNADLALYRAKADGRHAVCTYYPELSRIAGRRRQIEKDLRQAIGTAQLHLVYQPVIDVRRDRISGFEALLRWTHPEHGPIGPDEFIPIAEESGLIVPLGSWVLREACRTAAGWPPALRVGVNLSPVQLRCPTFPLQVMDTLAVTGLSPTRLLVEVTETAAMTHVAETLSSLTLLSELGISIALDDFGTGFSSLSNLREFRYESLKIDRSFVAEMTTDKDSAAIVRATVALAHELDMKVIAEGVETAGQLDMLTAVGCVHVQGFLFGRPMPREAVADILAREANPGRGALAAAARRAG
jgi:diguanylate cyclase (GGDEF)-like protein